MKHKLLHLQKIGMLFAFLIFGVVTGQAVNITYSLTTHVDGRTITGTASLSEGASLQDNMPQALWRGYTTYKYFSDAALTQEITTAPAEDATVYVDYVFDPPFQMSNDSKTVWNYLRNYNGGGTSHRYVYYQISDGRIYSQKNSPNNSSTSYYYQWAFFGDGYDFQIKSVYGSDNWLVWRGTNATIGLGAKPELGWQIYANAAPTTFGAPGGTVSLGIPETTSLVYLEDLGIALRTRNITSDHQFDSHNQLVAVHTGSGSQATQERNALWWYAFFSSPTSLAPATPDIWHVTYKIQKADGTWYDDIVIQKRSNNLTPSFPPAGFTPVEGCEYDYFYLDAEFTEKCADDYTMPNDRNTVLYIKEIETEEEIISKPWVTLVLPFTIEDVDEYFGPGAVEVDEYTSVEGHLRQSNGEELFICHLTFTPTTKIEAFKPYLFKANEVRESQLTEMYAIAAETTECIPVLWDDQTNAPGIFVSMKGVLETEGSEINNSDGLKFYFTSKYDESIEDYRYAFIRSKSSFIIPKNRCYFYVIDERSVSPSGAPLTLSFDGSGFTGIGQMVIEGTTASSKIYNINGQLIRVGSTNNLPKGIYIANGKKFIVK